MQDRSDTALMESVREGDHEAFRILLERYWSPLLAFARGMLQTPSSAEDIVQEAFIRVWRARSEWTPQGTPRAYLYQVVRNLALNEVRDRAVEARWESSLTETGRTQPSPPTPEETMAAETLRRAVDGAIQALPDRRREVFVLSRFHGLSHREIADALGIAPQTVSNQMKMALDHLRQALRSQTDKS